MGGVFNTVNANLYHYAANNPVKYTDPDGREAGYVLDNEGAFGMGHAGMYVKQEDGKYAFFEVTGISKETNGIDPNANIGSVYMDKNKKETVVLSNSQNSFPNKKISQKFGFPCNSGALMRLFDTSKEMEAYLKIAGFDESIEFATTPQQDKLIYNAALSNGRNFHGYNLINNSCGIFARGALTTNDSGIKPFNAVQKTLENQGILQYMASNAIPKLIGADFMTANKYILKRY